MSRFLRRFALCLLVLGALLLAAWCFRAPLLTGLANAWIVNEPLEKSDAIVVLGGGVENRPFEAARLYHRGLAPKILLMDVKLNPTTKLGLLPAEKDLTRRVLRKLEVPESALLVVGESVASTYDEARAVRAWAGKTKATRVIIPTDLFHTRRVRWLFRQQLKDTGTRVQVAAVTPKTYRAGDWWQHEEGLIAFQDEVIKYGYYRWEY